MLNKIINETIKEIDKTIKYMINNKEIIGKKYYLYYFKIKEYKKLLEDSLKNIDNLNEEEEKQLINLILQLNVKLIKIDIKEKEN